MDLVDKLRRQAAHDMDVGTLYSHVVDNEAADEIEFLRAQLAKETKNKKEFERDWLECCVTAEKYRKEAKRYQWLRDVGDATWRPFGIRAGYSADMADAAIDAAMTPNAEITGSALLRSPG